MTWIVEDTEFKRPYVDCQYRTLSEAIAAMEDLLKYFPEDNEWRKRLAPSFISEYKQTNRKGRVTVNSYDDDHVMCRRR